MDHPDDPAHASRSRVPIALLAAGILLFALSTTYMNRVKFLNLRSTWPHDLGYFHNCAFNAALGRTTIYTRVPAWFDTREHKGPSIYRTDHFSPMTTFVIPLLYRLWPRIETLMFLQSLLIGLGAVPLYFFVARRTGAARMGALVAASYLLHPAILHLAFNDYRDIALGLSFALFALWFHAERKPWHFLAAAALMLACRPEYVFLLSLFGLLNARALAPGSAARRWLFAPLLPAALWALLTHLYYLQAYGRDWPLVAQELGRVSPDALLGDLLTRLPTFLRIMLLPGAAALLAPEAFAVACPFVAKAVSVRWPAFPHHDLQHLAPAFAAIFWAFACGVVRLHPWLARSPRRLLCGQALLMAAAVLSGAEFGWAAARAYLFDGPSRTEEITRLDEALPADATVMVPKVLEARFSAHTRLLTHQELPLSIHSRMADSSRMLAGLADVCDLVAIEPGDATLAMLLAQSSRFQPPQTVGRFSIFVARPDAPRPNNPDASLQEILRWDEMDELERKWSGRPDR